MNNNSVMLQDALTKIKDTCNRLKVESSYCKYLSKPLRTMITNCPVVMDDGSIKIFQGYRVLHSNLLGPGKGGFRFSPTCTVEDLTALAMLMTWKSALIGLPLGGAKGSINADISKISLNEKERLVRRYTNSIINVIGPEQDIPSPDLNTNMQDMAWMMDTYSQNIGKTTPGVCTGKPVEIGGILGRNQAVGWGLADILQNYAKRSSVDINKQKIVIQGIGKVGRNAALMSKQFGSKIIAISDSTTGLYDPEGLDINDVIRYKNNTGSLKGYSKADLIPNTELLTLKCDALVPCATQNTITPEIAEKVECGVIIEGANSPTTCKSDKILDEKDIVVIPDIIANAGGLIVSYFEWVQDLSQIRWTLERVSKELKDIILHAFETVYDVKHKNNVTYRQAAYMIAMKRVITALKYRGIYP